MWWNPLHFKQTEDCCTWYQTCEVTSDVLLLLTANQVIETQQEGLKQFFAVLKPAQYFKKPVNPLHDVAFLEITA